MKFDLIHISLPEFLSATSTNYDHFVDAYKNVYIYLYVYVILLT